MGKPIIEVRGISKRYQLGAIGATRLRDDAERLWQRVTGKAAEVDKDEFWALRDVSFEVQPGEIVGIIGRNGAGKSTLLKILSRITEPTSGEIVMRGRVASLLEVGTGFVGDLSGRDNVYLNGAILGMSKAETRSKFDEIVAFSEIEKFIDTPVKRYSSGMYVRLAFAVAAHLEPEILIVDEVLAVGDAAFQKKCLGKMQEVSQRDGRTILLVSHTMPTILRLCNVALLMTGGLISASGKPEDVANIYATPALRLSAERVWGAQDAAPGNEHAKLQAIRFLNTDGRVSNFAEVHEDCFIEIDYFDSGRVPALQLTSAFHIINDAGIVAFASADFNDLEWRNASRSAGLVRARCKIPGHFLAEGRFTVLAAVVSYNPDTVHAMESEAISFEIVDRTNGEGARGLHAGFFWPGVVRPLLSWTVARMES